MQENTVLYGCAKQPYRLVKLLGTGGEGEVFETDIPGYVVKVYNRSKPNVAARMPELEQKLLYMVKTIQMNVVSKASGNCLVAWPRDVVYENGQFVGYLMPKVSNAKSILLINRGGPFAKQVVPDFNWKKALLIAENLAKVIRALHTYNIVVGDMNSNNILVYPNCDVAIIDTDSFDIRTKDNTHYKCKVGTEAFLPPELQGRDLSRESASFTIFSDEFALAVHIFQLLAQNYHPFNVKVTDSSQSVPQNKQDYNIGVGNCPFVRNIPGCEIPLGAPDIRRLLPPQLVQDFSATFGYQLNPASPDFSQQLQNAVVSRTSADTWYQHLHEFNARADTELVACSRNPEHFYLASVGSCELCAAGDRKQSGTQQIINSSSQSYSHSSATGGASQKTVSTGSGTTGSGTTGSGTTSSGTTGSGTTSFGSTGAGGGYTPPKPKSKKGGPIAALIILAIIIGVAMYYGSSPKWAVSLVINNSEYNTTTDTSIYNTGDWYTHWTITRGKSGESAAFRIKFVFPDGSVEEDKFSGSKGETGWISWYYTSGSGPKGMFYVYVYYDGELIAEKSARLQ